MPGLPSSDAVALSCLLPGAGLLVLCLVGGGSSRYFSGLGKTLPMMLWAQEEASIKFHLPDLPHLSESDRPLYKEQVRGGQREGAGQARRSLCSGGRGAGREGLCRLTRSRVSVGRQGSQGS